MVWLFEQGIKISSPFLDVHVTAENYDVALTLWSTAVAETYDQLCHTITSELEPGKRELQQRFADLVVPVA